MRPVLNKVNLQDLTYPQQRKICQCQITCKEGVSMTTYKDGMIICYNDARHFLYELIKLLDDGIGYTTFTDADEQFIINHIRKKGIYRGVNRELAEALGKSYAQMKGKLSRMRKKGLL